MVRVGSYYIEHCIDAAFEEYELDEDIQEWEDSSSCACIYCRVYSNGNCTHEIDNFVIHKDDIIDFLGLTDEDNILDIDIDDVFYQMAESGYLQEFII